MRRVGDCFCPAPGLHGPGPGGSGRSASASTSGSSSVGVTVRSVFVVGVLVVCGLVGGGVRGEIGGLITVPLVLDRTSSPYFIREDVIVDHSGELVIRPGVQLYFSPTVGITVFGRLIAEVHSHLITICTLGFHKKKLPDANEIILS